MSWIQERFDQQRNAPKKQPAPQADVGKEPPSWHDTWYRVRDAIRRDISEFNDQHDTPQFTFSNSPESLIYVRPQGGMVESAVLQIVNVRANTPLTDLIRSGFAAFTTIDGMPTCPLPCGSDRVPTRQVSLPNGMTLAGT